ncbi:MAG: anaerobic ribonucleoside-triphosphate reductase activating protein [archaeon]|nr:anaerobic ribonucleoside-triphosphate reductase activating protein [archaeon]
MHYGAIKRNDIANGIGIRTSLFVSGCTHQCPGCFQPQTWDFEYGEVYTEETEQRIIDLMRPDYNEGLTILGGEPMEPENQREIVKLIRRVRSELPGKTIWIYSGYTWAELTRESRARCEVTDEILSMTDVLVDGEFMESKKDITLRFRGSSNQNIIDVQSSLSNNKQMVLWRG